MTFNELIAAIKAAIKPNGERLITGQVLQDILVNIATWADDEETATRGILTTSIEPTLNAHLGLIQENTERIDDAEAELNGKADATDVASLASAVQSLETGKASTSDVASAMMYAEELSNAARAQAVETSEAYTDGAVSGRASWTEVVHIDNDVSDDVALRPHTFYIFDKLVAGDFTISEAQGVSSAQGLEASTFGLQFETGSTAPTVALPASWRFPEDPTIEPNTTYQLTVVNGFALIVGWPNNA